MVEEIVAKIKLDTGSLGKGGEAFTGKFMKSSEDLAKNTKATAFAVTTGLGIWEGIKKATDSLVKASPALQNTLNIFGQSMKLLLKPVGDLVSMILRPFALAFLKWAVPFYRDSMIDLKTTGGKVGGVAGGIAGAVVGGKIGAGIGTLANPGIGTAIGTVIGAFIGLLAGALAGIKIGAIVERWFINVIEFLKNVNWNEVFSFLVVGLPILVTEAWIKVGEQIGKYFTETLPQALGFSTQLIETIFTKILPESIALTGKSLIFLFNNLLPKLLEYLIKSITDTFLGAIRLILNYPQMIIESFNILKDFWLVTVPSWITGMFDIIKNSWESFKDNFNIGKQASKAIYGDVVITPQGQVINTSPQDYLFATKDPQSLINSGGSGSYNPTINIQASINSDIDIQRLAERIAEYSKDELSRRTMDFRI